MSVIVALDFENKDKTISFLKTFKEPMYVKVGMELFYGSGLEIIKEIKKLNHKIFLDLKLQDIPNTVKSAMRNLAKLDVDIVNLHASGGSKMMIAAKEGLVEGSVNGKVPLLIAVTELTSTSQEMLEKELQVNNTVLGSCINLAKLAKESGLDGVVCSPKEVEGIKEACGKDFLTVTPGIRLADSAKDDQVRITTPSDARLLGSDFIVVGRPITKALDPVSAYNQIKKDFMGE